MLASLLLRQGGTQPGLRAARAGLCASRCVRVLASACTHAPSVRMSLPPGPEPRASAPALSGIVCEAALAGPRSLSPADM